MRRFPSTKTAARICTQRALQIRPWGRMHHLVPRERAASSRRMRVAAYELAGAARRFHGVALRLRRNPRLYQRREGTPR
ncbi:hypothetical protein ALC57_01061, partial [Trachymyrmex cornetzi]